MSIENDIKQWIDRLSIKHNELSGFSLCPYASKANYVIVNNVHQAVDQVLNNNIDIAIIHYDNLLSARSMENLSSFYNEQYKNDDVWFLYDSVYEKNYVGDFVTSNGSHNLILVQRYSDLQKRSNHLLTNTKYYSSWSPVYFNKIVESRNER